MNILVLTQLYYIEGRPDLKHDTSAVHYLVKGWTKDNDVRVINTYINYRNHISRYLKSENRSFYKNGYKFLKDGVDVFLIENQLLTRRFFQSWNWNRLRKIILEYLAEVEFTPDVIVSHFPCYSYGFIDSITCNGKKIAILHESDVFAAKHDSNFIPEVEKKFDVCYSRSPKIRDFFVGYGLDNIGNEIVYSGAPIEANCNKNFDDITSRKTNILYAGKFISRKHVDWIIKSVSKCDKEKYHFHIVGSGAEESAYKMLIDELNISNNVTFYGQLTRDETMQKMDECDIFCMPSTGETFGLVYLEALSRGCVTIATRGEGIDGVIVNGENGYLIYGQDELDDLINRLIENPSPKEMSSVSQKGIETANYYSEDNVSKRYLDLISGR